MALFGKNLEIISKKNSPSAYILNEEIGSGSYGKVFKAKKFFKEQVSNSEEMYRTGTELEYFAVKIMNTMTTEEIKILSSVESGFLVKFIEAFQLEEYLNPSYYCIVMELCEGLSMNHKLNEYKRENKQFDSEVIFKWMKEIINGLEVLRKAGIIHRDIKPGNILLTFDDHVKIADFGISRIIDSSSLSSRKGTIDYMSPEILEGKNYNSKTDIWSAGCVLFELIFLERFSIKDYTLSKLVPAKLVELIKKMLVRKQEKRLYSNELEVLVTSLEKLKHNSLLTYYDFEETILPATNLPNPIQNFIERKSISWKNIIGLFSEKKFIVITSLPGSGKTTVANKIGWEWLKVSHSHFVYWIKSDEANLDCEFNKFASYIDVIRKDHQKLNTFIECINNKLSKLERKILFIFDNCESFKSIEPYTSLCYNSENVNFLLTSRDGSLSNYFKISQLFRVDAMIPEECFQYLEISLHSIVERKDLKALIKRFGFSVNQRIRPYALDKIIAHVRLKHADIRAVGFRCWIKGRNNNQIDTFDDLINILINVNQSSWEILKLSLFLDPDFIPYDFFTEKKSLFKIESATESIAKLAEFSLIKNAGINGFQLDRSLQEEILANLSRRNDTENNINKLKTNFIEKFVEKFQFDTRYKSTAHFSSYKMIAKYFLNDNETSDSIAKFFLSLADFICKNYEKKESIPYYEKSLSIFKRLQDVNNNNNNNSNKDKYNNKIIDILTKIIKVCETKVNPDLEWIAKLHESLANAYNKKCNYEDAIVNYNKSIEIYESMKLVVPGDYQKNIALNLKRISLSYSNMGEYKKAIETYNKSSSICFENNEEHANILSSIGTAYLDICNYVLAFEYFNDSLKIRSDLPKTEENSKYLANLYTGIGCAYAHLDKFEKAHEFYQKSLAIYTGLFLKEDFSSYLNRYKENLSSLSIIKNETKSYFANYWVNMSYLDLMQKNYELAFNKCNIASFILNKIFKEKQKYTYFENEIIVENLSILSAVHISKSEIKEAFECCEKAQGFFKSNAFSKYNAQIKNNIGLIYFSEQNFIGAKEAFEESLKLFEEHNEPNLRIAQVLKNISMNYKQLNEHEKALEFEKKASEMIAKIDNKLTFSRYVELLN